MKTLKFLLGFLALVAIVLSCQKEVSEENGSGTASDGSLQGAGGSCLGSTVGGVYQKDTSLNATNYVDVQVVVNTAGSYVISSDTANGMYFRATGNFSSTGVNTVRLPGFGKPLNTGTNTFTVTYDSTQCTFSITTIAGVGAAAFTLTGQGSNCSGAFSPPAGTYTAGVPTSAANTVTVEVNVTTVGSYSISASADGITFSKSGVFAATGIQTVVLTANGTPTTAGTFTVPVVAGTSTCSFSLTVAGGGGPAVYTLVGGPNACSGAFSLQGTYAQGTALTAANTVTVQVNVTTVGTYSLTTNTVNGFSFSASGTFSATGVQTVVMTNSGGSPTNSGSFTYTVTGASTTCTFSITVTAAVVDYFPRTTNSNWSYEFDGDQTDSLRTNVIANTISGGGNTFNIFMYLYQGATDTMGYYRKSGSDYYHWVNLADYLYFDNDQWAEINFIKDNQAQNFSWTSPGFAGMIGGTPITLRIKWTILQQNVPVTMTTSTGSVTYQNTILVQEKYEYQQGTTWVDGTSLFGYYKDWYSRNVGWIKEEGYDQSSMLAYTMDMRRYQVF
jgi:hypothetical protein